MPGRNLDPGLRTFVATSPIAKGVHRLRVYWCKKNGHRVWPYKGIAQPFSMNRMALAMLLVSPLRASDIDANSRAGFTVCHSARHVVHVRRFVDPMADYVFSFY